MSFKVLVVEDNMADFDLIAMCIQEALGQEVSTSRAASVEEAGELMSQCDYSVIIRDLFLPPYGAEAITAVYKRSPETPIIAISGESSPDLHRTAIANGAKLFCAKSDLRTDNIISILASVVPAIKNR